MVSAVLQRLLIGLQETEHFQMEPVGAGFGHAGSVRPDGSIDEFSRGAGEPITDFSNTEPTSIGTSFTQDNDE